MTTSRRSIILLCLAPFAVGAAACGGDDPANDEQDATALSPALVAAARANLARVTKEIDYHHMQNYGLEGELADQFVQAVKTEYGATPALLKRRMQTLASMVFFSAPEVKTNPKLGKITPFHGMDEAAFEALMASEDTVFEHHTGVNGNSPNGVRPFSVCETTFMISIAKGENTDAAYVSDKRIVNYDAYAVAYQKFAKSCPKKDLTEWYNFRGLGGLRPSWLESNVSDRFLRRMVSDCKSPPPELAADCKDWDKNRLSYRDRKNTELALREVFYDPNPATKIAGSGDGSADKTMEEYLLDSNNGGVLVEDRNGDGIGEWISEGDLLAKSGALLALPTNAQFELPSDQTLSTTAASTVIIEGTSEKRQIASGTPLKLAAGASVALSSKLTYKLGSNAPIAIASGTKLRLAEGTSVQLPDGATAHIPQSWEVDGTVTKVEAKLGQALSLAVADGWVPKLDIDSPLSGALAGKQFAGELHVAIELESGGSITGVINLQDAGAYDQVDPAWKPEYLKRADLGMQAIFSDGSGCMADSPSADTCPMLRRFYSVIDRHENFYQTYSGLKPASASVSQQPSPLVACSITLAASHAWDTAGTPDGGTAGFIYLMRIPFNQILVGDRRSIDTLGLLADKDGDGKPDSSLTAGPTVLTLQELYAGEKLDMSKVWLDIATLSHNQYESEHEVSKFGSVPAEQIEGMLVIRMPAAMSGQGGNP